jgi:hypothetical protein
LYAFSFCLSTSLLEDNCLSKVVIPVISFSKATLAFFLLLRSHKSNALLLHYIPELREGINKATSQLSPLQ